MKINLYTTKSKTNTINKVKNVVKTLDGNMLTPFSVINPSITVNTDMSILNSNYAYIEKFKRYYFIEDIQIDKGQMTLVLKVDVLESFKAEILEYNGIIERQEFDYNLYLEDKEVLAYSKNLIQYKAFPSKPFIPTISDGDKRFVLITTSD